MYNKGGSLPILRPHQQSANVSMGIHNIGQVIMPTGSGKTYTMAYDINTQNLKGEQVSVVVGPTIVLTQQLCREMLECVKDVRVMHVHSGNTGYFTTTNPNDIAGWVQYMRGNKLIFTTYHSLHRIVESGISVDTIYYDEAHNSIQSRWFGDVKKLTTTAKRCYYFTATPKHSITPDKPGMNDINVYGGIICDVPTTEMISEGYIVPPTLHTITVDEVVSGKYPAEVDINQLINAIKSHNLNQVLVSCKNTTQLYHISTSERFNTFCTDGEYTIYSICSKYGCFINDKKVRRNYMMKNMKENTGKFVLFHIETLCEGINLPNLDGIVLMKKLSTIKMVQSIGRVLRKAEGKTEGKVILPLYSKYLTKAETPVMNLMQRVYTDGDTPTEIIRR
jgi:superfamily II DNA or RNA helicase